MLDVGNLLQPVQTATQHKTLRNQGSDQQDLNISPLGAPHELGADVEPLSLDVQTFRAFQREEQIVDAWNKDMHTLMKRSDQEKRGELKIGVALPSVVESVLGEGGAGGVRFVFPDVRSGPMSPTPRCSGKASSRR